MEAALLLKAAIPKKLLVLVLIQYLAETKLCRQNCLNTSDVLSRCQRVAAVTSSPPGGKFPLISACYVYKWDVFPAAAPRKTQLGQTHF